MKTTITIEDVTHWDAAIWYTEGDIVRVGDRVFTAKPVPQSRLGDYVDVNVGINPPDGALFWKEDVKMIFQCTVSGSDTIEVTANASVVAIESRDEEDILALIILTKESAREMGEHLINLSAGLPE